MDTFEFLSHLRSLNVKLVVDGDRLRCNAPKGALNPDLLSEITRRKADIIDFLNRSDAIRNSDPMSVSPVKCEGSLPLSFAQQRLWFLDQLQPNNHVYNIPRATHIKGKVSVDALQKALDAIGTRHSSLRTTFHSVNGIPVQVISEGRTVDLPVVDLSTYPVSEREKEAERLIIEEFHRPFNLTKDLMLRARLIKLDDENYIFTIVVHHIASDGWSMGVLYRELEVLYEELWKSSIKFDQAFSKLEAFVSGKSSPLPELPFQYADYAVWQRQWLQGARLEAQISYWKNQLKGAPPVLELPADFPRPSVQTYRGEQQHLILSKSLTDALRSLSNQEGVTLFMTLVAAFKVLLYRWTRQEDIVIGIPIAGRNRAEIEDLIGFFVNTLVLRTDLSGNPSFSDLLDRVRKVAVEAYAHQDMPFEKLVEELQPDRNLSRNPVFDIMFNSFDIPQMQLKLPGVECSGFMRLIGSEAKFSMTLYAKPEESDIKMWLVYQRDLFSAERMISFLSQYHYLLQQIVNDPEKTIRSYSLAAPEALSLLPDLSKPLPEPYYEPVTSLFASWAERTPEQTAILQGYSAWTYGQLAESSHAIAQALLTCGIQRGDVIGIFGPRSFGLVASMIGVLLSGGVMLTIDQKLPVQRQKLMLHEAKARYLLYIGFQKPNVELWKSSIKFGQALEKLDDLAQESLAVTLIDPDAGKPVDSDINLHPENIELPQINPDDAAYIFFTSGSTGTPKGILGCHKGISHFLDWQRRTFTVAQTDRCAQLTNLSFDVLLRDVFLPLTSGAILCLPSEEFDTSSPQILQWMEREQISILHVVPSLAQSWLVNIPQGVSLRSLRWAFFAGESLTDTLVCRWREAFPESGQMVNLYGPTETTMVKCSYLIHSRPSPGIQPIGFPLPETQVLVLSEENQLCGISEPGEIAIRTPFRTLGYINAPEENQRHFVKNFSRNDEQDLIYYTGDRGRYRPDGSLDILGRLDNQIKVRGIRIEPGEIEVTLGQHPDIWESAVIALGDSPVDRRLVAYIVPKQNQNPTIGELRRFLKHRLPEYMVPSAFVILESLPLTPNGKVDRRALPSLDHSRPKLEVTFTVPRTPVEQRISEIWAQVLGLEKIGIHDNFFELGGHSLLATQVISRMSSEFKMDIPLRSLFESPTIAELASLIVKKHAEQTDTETLTRILEELGQLSGDDTTKQ